MPAFLSTDEQRQSLADRILLATQLSIESRQLQGASILCRFDTVLALKPNLVMASFECAKYCEFLFHDVLEKEILNLSSPLSSSHSSANGGSTTTSVTNSLMVAQSYIEKAIEQYTQCLLIGGTLSTDKENSYHEGDNQERQEAKETEKDIVAQSLPRLLTLWLSFTEIRLPSSISSSVSSVLSNIQNKVNETMLALVQKAGAHVWFPAMQQLVSRAAHRNVETVAVIERSVLMFSETCMFLLFTLSYSLIFQFFIVCC
jgi:hypothetical protein